MLSTGAVTKAGKRAEPDVANAQVQQRQQNRHGLLLIPRQDQRKRQVVHAAVERLGQRQGDLDGGVGVVALPDVQQPRNAADVAEIELVEAVLAARRASGSRSPSGHGLGELGVVVAAGLGAVAAADEEEVLDGAALHRVDHLARDAQHGLVAEAGQDGLRRRVGREAVGGQRRP